LAILWLPRSRTPEFAERSLLESLGPRLATDTLRAEAVVLEKKSDPTIVWTGRS
jgi:hypothetical protein